MDPQVAHLVEKTWGKYLATPPTQRLLIGIGGIPGSGKTTLAAKVAHAINERSSHEHEHDTPEPTIPIAAVIPMDGYHLTRAQLSALPNAATAHARRGAAFTFDAAGFLSLVTALREPLSERTRTLYAPSFDHTVKDPVADDIPIAPKTRVLLFEGNYVALDEEPWASARRLLDECWFVEVAEEVARRRLVRRHVEAGIVADEEAAGRRVEENDLVNGREILARRGVVDEVVVSVEDGEWEDGRPGGVG